MAVAAFMIMFMMLSIMDMLMLVHLAIVTMRMGMLICGMTTHLLFTSVLLNLAWHISYLSLSDGSFDE